MNQYIDKDALLTKIERRLEALASTSTGDNREFAAIIGAQYYELKSLVQYINTLEVKEINSTNAFTEKVENFLEMLGYGFTITDNITHTNYDKKQLIEDFKNYMKGE